MGGSPEDVCTLWTTTTTIKTTTTKRVFTISSPCGPRGTGELKSPAFKNAMMSLICNVILQDQIESIVKAN